MISGWLIQPRWGLAIAYHCGSPRITSQRGLELLQAELQNSQLSNWGYALAAHRQSQGADHHPHAPSLIWQHITIIIIIYIFAVTHV